MPVDAPVAPECDDRTGVSHSNVRRGGRVVMVVGPSPRALGGMAGVIELMGTLQFPPRWRLEFFTTTASRDGREGLVGRLARHISHLRLLRRTLRASHASIAHIHTCSGVSFFRSAADMLLARRHGCRVVLHIHGAAFDEFFKGIGVVGRWAIRWILTRSDCVVALSASWRRKLTLMAPRARITVLENACPIAADVPIRTHQGVCRFLLLARMDTWKGIDDLLKACAKLQKDDCAFELVFAGPPGTAGDVRILRDKIRALGVTASVRYVGPAVGAEKTLLLRWADVYVQPSHAEGMPLSLLEAMAHRLPVVATTVGAVPEVIDDGVEGLLVPSHRPDQLAAAMRRLILDAQLRDRLAVAGAALAASRFSPCRFRDDLVRLYDALASREAKSQPDYSVSLSPVLKSNRASARKLITTTDQVP